MKIKARFTIVPIFVLLILILNSQAGKPNQINQFRLMKNVTAKEQDIDFSLTLAYEKTFLDETAATVENVSTILDQIPEFRSNETQFFTNRTFGEYYLSINIENITVFDDKDGFNDGEIYLEVWSNSIYTKLDNGGFFYILDDGGINSAIINTLTFDDWANLTDIYIEVKESDLDFDDELGSITISGVYDYDWTQGFYTDTNDALVYISAFITGYRNVTIDEYDVAYYYQPYVVLDNGDYADAPTALFYRVFEGYDIELESPTICIQYLYYWPYELDNFGTELGHYYDFSPIYLYITDFGYSPYRIVYQENNPGLTALPSQLTVHSTSYTSDMTGAGTFNVSEPLRPLLGETASFEYNLHPISDYYGQGYYVYPLSEFPLLSTPIVLITDSYHNIQTSYIAVDSNDLGYYPDLTYFDDDLIYSSYWLLNESFNSPLHDYSWNFYEVPENLSLTIDTLQNPFEFPYIIDCFENVTHQNRYARESKDTDFDGVIELTTTLNIPATIYIEHPSNLAPGESGTGSVWIDMHGDDVTLTFDYIVKLNAFFNMWFLSKNVTFDYDGQIEIKIPLETISSFQQQTGLNEFAEVWEFRDYLSINRLYIDTTLLGTVLNASVSIHLLDIIKDLVNMFYPPAGPLLTLSEFFLESIDLVLTPELTGLVMGEITTNSPLDIILTQTQFTFIQENTPHNFNIDVKNDISSDNPQIILQNINYGLNFTNQWDLVITPGIFLEYFDVQELIVPLGVFPSLQWSVAQPTDQIDANTQITTFINIKRPSTSQISTSSSEPSTEPSSKSSETTSGWSLSIIFLSIIPILYVKRILKRRK